MEREKQLLRYSVAAVFHVRVSAGAAGARQNKAVHVCNIQQLVALVIAATKTNRMCTHCCGKPLPACLMVVVNIMQACVILGNMIVEDENKLIRVFLDLNENAPT